MSDDVLGLLIRIREEGSAKVGQISKSFDSLGDSAGRAHGKTSMLSSVLSGVGAGVGITGVMGVVGAVSTLTGVLGGAVRSAMDEQAGMARLTISVRDAIPAWDGNTKAIEAAIRARIGLGFNDDALRSSFTGLVARTHDVSEALRLQSVAMDIARFRGVDLEAASIAVGKAYQGSSVALQRMGIAVKAGSSGQEALAQAIAATRGQADAYASTSAGKMEGAQGRLNETMQRFGQVVLPAVADAANNLSNVLELLNGAMDSTGDSAKGANAASATWDHTLEMVTFGASQAFAAVMDLAGSQAKAAEASRQAASDLAEFTASVDAERVALGAASIATYTATAAAYAQIDAYVIATHAADERADAENRLAGSLEQLRVSMNANVRTSAIQNATSDSATRKQLALAAGLNTLQDAYVPVIASTAKFSGGLSDAAQKAEELRRKVQAQLADAFERFKTAALAAMDKIHQAKLRAIDDAQKLADAEYKAQRAAIEGPVDAARAALDATRAARDLADAQREVGEAIASGDQARVESANRRLGDLQADQNIAAMQREAQAKVTDLDVAKAAADKKREDDAKAEEQRYKDQKAAFEADLKALETALAALEEKYKGKTTQLIKVMQGYNADFTKLGKKLGVAYASGAVEGLDTLIPRIAKKVAELLGKPATPTGGGVGAAGAPQGGDNYGYDASGHPIEPPGLAAGGRVRPWEAYIVGERRAEVFVPDRSGTILPSTGGGNVTLSVTVTGPAIFDPLGIAAQQVAAALLPSVKRALAQQNTTF